MTYRFKKQTNFTCSLSQLCLITSGTNCQFPTHWTGSWFQKGFRDPVYIKNGSLSSRGVCRKVEGEKFLIESKSESCFRCIVIHERHKNVLQFKETYCSSNSDLEQKCREISGDAPLYSMFRLNTTPTACPFKDSFTFSYSRGYGECSNPISTVDSCSNQSQLFFKFQACADVRNSESREEKLTCYGTWKEGSTWYLVAKLEHKGTITEEDKFRCFVYDKLKNESGYQVAQSGDATCDGLFSATEGSRTMTLIRSERFSGAKCHFPHWFMKFSHWQSLDGSKLFTTDHRLKSFYLSNTSREGDSIRLACNRISKQQDSLYEMAVQVTSGCMFGNRGYRCMRIHQRTKHVIEVQMGNQVLHASEACSEEVFNSADERYVTLTTKDPRKVGCPVVGEYTMIESKPQFAELVASGLDDLRLRVEVSSFQQPVTSMISWNFGRSVHQKTKSKKTCKLLNVMMSYPILETCQPPDIMIVKSYPINLSSPGCNDSQVVSRKLINWVFNVKAGGRKMGPTLLLQVFRRQEGDTAW
ncbi:uncharacterized protein LOC143236952 [Tachypleus tridentatus]|uniref:uncharacterized protein LOC143236952 n=1 Tax=Tachypleus tridentatus TaxID=6853 RepID=UPI003FD0FFB2